MHFLMWVEALTAAGRFSLLGPVPSESDEPLFGRFCPNPEDMSNLLGA